MTDTDIQYVSNADINKKKWDACIRNAHNSLIYAHSFYLGAMTKNWDALVWNDYEAIMPLTWNKKWGITYLYQPHFTQQLGIFSRDPLPMQLMNAFLSVATSNFRFAEIFLNHRNKVSNATATDNYVLHLDKSYSSIQKGYSPTLLRHLKKAVTAGMIYNDDIAYSTIIAAFKKNYGAKMPQVVSADYTRLEKACSLAANENKLLLRKVLNQQGEVAAMALLLKDEKRMYLSLPVTTNAGRNINANHFLLDELIKEFAGTAVTLDFKGSIIPGVAQFYRSFGAINEPYYFYKWNDLPWPVRLLK